MGAFDFGRYKRNMDGDAPAPDRGSDLLHHFAVVGAHKLGYCTTCHRVRYVRVLPDHSIMGVAHGECTQCERERKEKQSDKKGL